MASIPIPPPTPNFLSKLRKKLPAALASLVGKVPAVAESVAPFVVPAGVTSPLMGQLVKGAEPAIAGLKGAGKFFAGPGEEIPLQVQRIEEAGGTGFVNKPQGFYTTPAAVKSPHLDLGGKLTKYNVNQEADILRISPDTPSTIPYGEGDLGIMSRFRGHLATLSAGVRALMQLAPEEFTTIKQLGKSEAAAYLKKKYPTVEWGRYFDTWEMMEGLGGTLAREAGFDAVWAPDKALPEFSEFVALTEKALK